MAANNAANIIQRATSQQYYVYPAMAIMACSNEKQPAAPYNTTMAFTTLDHHWEKVTQY